jgi:DNA (cytosine-5)-methyltransferase 1
MNPNFTFVDLFAGCGGLSEGFYKQGFKPLAHIEHDHYSCESLRMRMDYYGYIEKNSSVIEKNITDKDILETIRTSTKGKKIDLILGGPPCQSFSSLGRAKDKNSMKNDPRNYLFENYKKILNYFRPNIFLFENVTGLLTAKFHNKKTINIIIESLGKNYDILDNSKEIVLNSCEYGVPQIRKRVFLIGVRKDINYSVDTIFKNIIKTHYTPSSKADEKFNKKKYITTKEAIGDLPFLKPGEGAIKSNFNIKTKNDYLKKIRSERNTLLFDHVARKHNNLDRKRFKEMAKNKWTFMELLKEKPSLRHKKQRVFKNSYVVQCWDMPSKTIISHLYKDGNQFIHPDYKQERTLTVREAARLQSFPDDFYFAGPRTEQYRQIGNAVPPLLSEKIAISIKKALKEIKRQQ